MGTDIKFVCVATGLNGGALTSLATRHADWLVGRLNARKGKADSPLTLPGLVRFIHFD